MHGAGQAGTPVGDLARLPARVEDGVDGLLDVHAVPAGHLPELRVRHVQHFAAPETPHFVGRAVAALAGDPDVGRRTGEVLISWDLAEQYGSHDVDGSRPHWGRHHADEVLGRS